MLCCVRCGLCLTFRGLSVCLSLWLGKAENPAVSVESIDTLRGDGQTHVGHSNHV